MLVAFVMFCKPRLAEETVRATPKNNVWVTRRVRENMAKVRDARAGNAMYLTMSVGIGELRAAWL